MKKIGLFMALCALMLTACEKEQDMYKLLPIEQVKPATLAAPSSLEITTSSYNDKATFSWTKADFGAPVAAQYSLYVQIGDTSTLVTSIYGDTLKVSLLDIAKAVYKLDITLDTPTEAGFYLEASVSTAYGIATSALVKSTITLATGVPVYPEKVYMIGQEFGTWNWADAGVVEMTPVHSHSGKFWAVRYFADPADGFKWSNAKAWGGDFASLGTNVGFTVSSGNAVVAAAGLYLVMVDYTTATITIEPTQIFGIGDCFGGWDSGKYPFTINGNEVKITTTAAANVRMYATSATACAGIDWWQMEFVVLDGKIAYRGTGGDQTAVPTEAGKTVTLDFNAGTGTIQ